MTVSHASASVDDRTATSGGDRAPRLVAAVRHGAGPMALLAGPLLTVVGFAFHPKRADDAAFIAWVDAHGHRWTLAHLLIGLGLLLLAGGVGSALRLAAGRGARFVTAGVVAVLLGALGMALDAIGHGAVGTALAGRHDVSLSLSLAVQKGFESHSNHLLTLLPLLFPVGVVLLGIGVLRSRRTPAWAAVLLILGPVGLQFAGAGPLELLGAAPLVIGFGSVALAAYRTLG